MKETLNPDISSQAADSLLCQEPIFILIDGMGLHFDDTLARQREDSLQAPIRLEGCQREEIVRQTVAPGQHAIYDAAIEPIP